MKYRKINRSTTYEKAHICNGEGVGRVLPPFLRTVAHTHRAAPTVLI